MRKDGASEAGTDAAETVEHDRRAEIPFMIDRFVIEDELGMGGMGRVYLAYDPSLDRRVAVKLLREQLGTDRAKAHARMAREARAMARLRDPNVVTVHEVGMSDDCVFIVMEYVSGGTLRDWLLRTPDATWRDIVAIYVQAGRGLAAAHEAGLVHRDFKPDNVLVGSDGRVLVTDFGIANIADDGEPRPSTAEVPPRLTGAGAVLGTPPYMSPEQHLGRAIDPTSDQFAFCAALYEALHGTPPFVGGSTAEIAERAIRGDLAPPKLDRGVPSPIAAAVRRGLAPDPADRFPSLTKLLGTLTTERRRPARWIALGAAAAAIGALMIWFASRGSAAPDPPTSAVIAVEPVELVTSSSPQSTEWKDAVGDVLALVLADVDGVKAVGPTYLLGADARRDLRAESMPASTWQTAEANAGAGYVVRGVIEERGGRVHGSLRLVAPGRTQLIELDRPRDQLAMLLDDSADAIARAIDPRKSLPRATPGSRARALFAIGNEHLRAGDYQVARPFLEQATLADPASFDAWYALALVRSWVLAPESEVVAALDAARATAPSPVKRQLVEGAGHFLRREFTAAQDALDGLAKRSDLSTLDKRDALYFLGEAHWHDGHHKIGVGYLQQALELDLRFKLPAQHLAEYAIANRDPVMMRQYTSLMGLTRGDELRGAIDFVLGRYEELARDGSAATRLYATLVLGRTPTPEIEQHLATNPVDLHTYRAARALNAGDHAAATAELDQLWAIVLARKKLGELSDGTYHSLRMIGDVVITAGDVGEARRVVEFLAEQSRVRPVRGYQRLSILAAALVADRAWIVRRELTDRDRRLADAMDAELTGDHARAVALLKGIVGDPSPFWDYPERMALLRNLRASHRTAEARALCDDTLRPAIFQWAYLPARRICEHP